MAALMGVIMLACDNATAPPTNQPPTCHTFVNGVCVVPGCHMIRAVRIPEGSLDIDRASGTGKITLDAFYMMVFEVTQELFSAVMGFNPSHFTPALDRPAAPGERQGRRPVEMVTWFDAVYFANLLSEREGLEPVYAIDTESITRESNGEGRGYRITYMTVAWQAGNPNGWRLPTEAEWEYANRAVAVTPGSDEGWLWHFGDDPEELGNYAWYGVPYAQGGMTREVGRREPNAWGLFDTHGNVSEWVWDWADWSDWPGTFPAADATDPRGPDAGSFRVRCGGGFILPADGTHSAFRFGVTPVNRYILLGFRLVRPCVL